MAFNERRIQSGDGLSLYYRDYSGRGGVPVLCLHGLTRNSKDFEDLAPRLAPARRVLCADQRGRGQSDYDPNYKNYHPGTYADDMWRLLDHAGVDGAALIGTSLGGIMAMLMTSQHPERVAAVVLNDVGPALDPRGVERIAGYAGRMPPVASWGEAAAAIRAINEAAQPGLSEADWMGFARRTYREGPDGAPVLDYDPAIGLALTEAGSAPPDMWPLFEALAGRPVLVIRGETSDILTAATVETMTARMPGLQTAVVPGVGHAPMLNEPEALTALESFLTRIDAISGRA